MSAVFRHFLSAVTTVAFLTGGVTYATVCAHTAYEKGVAYQSCPFNGIVVEKSAPNLGDEQWGLVEVLEMENLTYQLYHNIEHPDIPISAVVGRSADGLVFIRWQVDDVVYASDSINNITCAFSVDKHGEGPWDLYGFVKALRRALSSKTEK